MQRARAMEGRRSENELRHGLPTRPTNRDALHAARGAHRHLQRHQLRAHDPAEPATAARASPRAPAACTTAPARAGAPSPAPTAGARCARAGARRATADRAAEAAEARQEEAAAPRPVRPRPSTTTAAARAAGDATAAATTTGAQRAGPSGSRACGGAAGVLPVHAVAAAKVGGDAEAARVLLRGVPVQLPDAGAGGHLQHRHRRQQAHHHLQRGEPQRLRNRLSECGRRRRGPNEVLPAPYFRCLTCTEKNPVPFSTCSGRRCTDKEKGIVWVQTFALCGFGPYLLFVLFSRVLSLAKRRRD